MKPLLFLALTFLAGCLHPIVKVEKNCVVGRGAPKCICRDLETGKFKACP